MDSKKQKSWIKGTVEGKLYIDTSNHEWQKWFIEQIKKYSKLNILNRKGLKMASVSDNDPKDLYTELESIVMRRLPPEEYEEGEDISAIVGTCNDKTMNKKTEIAKDNALIASFMGHDKLYSHTNQTVTPIEFIPYHSSWDWIIPVVEKIEDIEISDNHVVRTGANVKIYYKACRIEYEPDEDSGDEHDEFSF